MVECGFKMAASNTLSNGHSVQRRSGGNAGGASQNNKSVLAFQCQLEHHQDSARLHSNGNCGENKQYRGDFFSSKDPGRRKRGNRFAKLKQCKLDARREQWLSQGSQGKQWNSEKQLQNNQLPYQNCEHHHKVGDGECMPQERASPSGHTRSQSLGSIGSMSERIPIFSLASQSRSSGNGSNNEVKNLKKEAPARRQDVSCRAPKYFGDEELDGGSEQKQGPKHLRSSSDISKLRFNISGASSSYTGSGSEDHDEPHDADDDWESAFDALHIQSSQHRPEALHKCPGSDRALHSEEKEQHDRKQNGAHHYNPHHSDMQGSQLKSDYKHRNSGFGGRRGNGGRAWRPDDVSRPPTLPTLVKQHTYPNHSGNNNHQGWGHAHGSTWENQQPSPSYCPICTEELDMTDSSYMPCPCGFQLCLFCYHRIASDDGRCPGCRKPYSTDVAVKLSQSSAVWLRV